MCEKIWTKGGECVATRKSYGQQRFIGGTGSLLSTINDSMDEPSVVLGNYFDFVSVESWLKKFHYDIGFNPFGSVPSHQADPECKYSQNLLL